MGITDHEFVNYMGEDFPPEHRQNCQYVYMPDNSAYADPSGGWMMGGPIECGGTPEQHQAAT